MSGRWRWLLGAACGLALALAGTRCANSGFRISDFGFRRGQGGTAEDRSSPNPKSEIRNPKSLQPRVTPEMERYSYTRYALYFVGVAWQVVALLAIFRSGLSARLRDAAVRRMRFRYGQVLVYYLLFSALLGLAMLPLSFYSEWLLEHRYRLSHQTLPRWAWEGVKGYLVGAVLVPPILTLLYLCVARSPRRWWLGFWLASIPIAVILMLLAPVAIDPIFHRFEPLRDAALREKILALARRAGIEGGRVFQVDMSRETKKMNAYVYGLGSDEADRALGHDAGGDAGR